MRGCCIPRSHKQILPWAGFCSEQKLTEFLEKHIDKCGCVINENKVCEDSDRINKAPFLENEITTADPITDMEKYLHEILDTDDPETMEYKYYHYYALINNTQL